MFEYRYQLSQDHFIQSMERYRGQKTGSMIRLVLKGICYVVVVPLMLICLVGFLILAVMLKPAAFGMLTGFMLFFVLFMGLRAGPQMDYWLMKRQLKKSTLYNQPITVTLSPEGLQTRTESTFSETPWSTFTSVCRMSDGFMVFQGREQYHWLPDLSLNTGPLSGVEQLLKESGVKFKT